jgi:hypothetical protein
MKKLFFLLSFVFTLVFGASAQNELSVTLDIPVPLVVDTPAPKMVVKDTSAPKKGAIMTFDTKYFDFGKLKIGDKPSHTFNFVNTGDEDLEIEVVSGCDCTEIEYTQTVVKPGGKGSIKAIFNTNKVEHDEIGKVLNKDMTIVLKNKYPNSEYPMVEQLKFDVFSDK